MTITLSAANKSGNKSLEAGRPPESSSMMIGQSFILVITIVLIVFGFGCRPSFQIGFTPKLITRFCYNSPNLSTINSQCVLCNYYMFDATVLGCTGSTALTVNITASQAFCVISQCLGQIRQQPIFLGRRKRSFSVGSSDQADHRLISDSRASTTESIQSDNSTAFDYRIVKEVEADIVDDDDDHDFVDDDEGYAEQEEGEDVRGKH